MRVLYVSCLILALAVPAFAGEVPADRSSSRSSQGGRVVTMGIDQFNGGPWGASDIIVGALSEELRSRSFEVVADGQLRENIKSEVDYEEVNAEYFRKIVKKGRWIPPKFKISEGTILSERIEGGSNGNYELHATPVEWRMTVNLTIVEVGTVRRASLTSTKKYREVQASLNLNTGRGGFGNLLGNSLSLSTPPKSELEVTDKLAKSLCSELANEIGNFVRKKR